MSTVPGLASDRPRDIILKRSDPSRRSIVALLIRTNHDELSTTIRGYIARETTTPDVREISRKFGRAYS